MDSPQKPTVAAMAGVSSRSSGYSNDLGAMRGLSCIVLPPDAAVQGEVLAWQWTPRPRRNR